MSAPTSCVIGIAGGSASGKTTFAKILQSYIGEDRCRILYQDSYYIDQSDRFDKDGGAVNFDSPEAIEFSLMADHLKLLRVGKSVEVPSYDFATHTRQKKTITFKPVPVVLVDGTLILSQEKLRDLFDFKIFIQTGEELRYQRRLSRDMRERGRTAEGVKEQFTNQVKPMHDLHVEPSRHQADKIFSGETDLEPSVRNVLNLLKQKGIQGIEARA